MSKMVAGYKLMAYTILRKSDNYQIPKDAPGNKDYEEYLKWLDFGNEPEPEFTAEEIIENDKNMEKAKLKKELKADEIDVYSILNELWAAMKIMGATNQDIDHKLLSKMEKWITKLDRLNEIDK